MKEKRFYEDLTEFALCEASKAINEIFNEIDEDRRKGKKIDNSKKGQPIELRLNGYGEMKVCDIFKKENQKE